MLDDAHGRPWVHCADVDRLPAQVVNGLGWLRGCCLARAYTPPAPEELITMAALKGGLVSR